MKLGLLVIQIDGLHIGNDLVLIAALGIDGNGDKRPLGLVEGATVKIRCGPGADRNLIERGFEPDGLSAVLRRATRLGLILLNRRLACCDATNTGGSTTPQNIQPALGFKNASTQIRPRSC